MTWNYISGFFDADGSITIAKVRKNNPIKTIYVSFDNTKRSILEQIQAFILAETGHKSSICVKKTVSERHSPAYTLQYTNLPKCLDILKNIKSIHPIKSKRIALVLSKMKSLTPRNGKYTKEMLAAREKFQSDFLSIK